MIIRAGKIFPAKTSTGFFLTLEQIADRFAPAFVLIDGSAHIFCAYFALLPLNHSTGLPTNALYGF